MRLKQIEIKNFRSIKRTTLELLDLDVTTLIGANGSGKSNILKAITALKGDDTTPSDRDFHAKDPAGEEAIEISATFIFEERDVQLLKDAGFIDIQIEGFKVTIEKELGKSPTIQHDPVGYVDKRSTTVQNIQNVLVSLIKSLSVEESLQTAKQACIDSCKQVINLDTKTIETETQKLSASFEPLKEINADISSKVVKTINDLKNITSLNFDEKLTTIFEKINIELLHLNAYKIEDRAPITELQDGALHPFLFDLLKLTNKKANDFAQTNTPTLSRIKKQAASHLSDSIADIWLSHDLTFEIDKQGESLEFMVFTPQEHQISLTDLSDGEQWFLKFYIRLAIAQKEGRQIIWLFDEPGRDLHTSSQMDLKGFFETISIDAQVIYTSHLAMMIPWHRLERIFAIENSESEGTIIHKRFWKDSRLNSPLKEALSTFVGEELLGGKEHLIVEGISDYFFLYGWLRHFQNQKPEKSWTAHYALYKRILVPADGIEKIPLYCWFLGRNVKKCINWVVIVDSASESESTIKKMTDTGLGLWTKNVKSIGEIAGLKKDTIEEIEGIFKPEEYIKLFEDYYAIEYPNCILPTREEILAKLATETKITKTVDELLTEKNPTLTNKEGVLIGLDKTGISQYAYKLLSNEKVPFYSKETESKFLKIFENLEKTFENQFE